MKKLRFQDKRFAQGHRVGRGWDFGWDLTLVFIYIFDLHVGGLVTQSCPTLATSWTVACQAPLFMGFSRQEYWSGEFPSPFDFPSPYPSPFDLHTASQSSFLFVLSIHFLNPSFGKIPWRRKWQPTPVFLLGKSHGQRSLVGYSPQGPKESDMTEQLHFTSFIL